MNVLIIGKDPALFRREGAAEMGDARRRHIYYSQQLRARFPGAEMRIVSYTPRTCDVTVDEPAPGLRLYGTASRHRALFMLDLPRTLEAVLADGWRPDVVTVQEPWEEGIVGMRVARRLHARFIPQLHLDMFSRDWLREHWLNPLRQRLAYHVFSRADRIRVVSEPLRQQLSQKCRIALEKIRVAPVGVNFNPILGADKAQLKARLSPLPGGPVVLFVGRLYAPKNLDLWVDVAARVSKRIPDASFCIVGKGPDEAQLRRRVSEAGLDGRFSFCGSKRHDELPPIYAAADVFLLTSHYEGFGRVVLEAMLSGVPVVSTACTGPEDLIDASTGCLLAKGDAEGLAAAVCDLLGNPDKAQAMGAAGRRRVMSDFSLETLARRMIDVWAEQ